MAAANDSEPLKAETKNKAGDPKMSRYVKKEILSREVSDDGFLERIHLHVTYQLRHCPCCGTRSSIHPIDYEENGDFMIAECPKCGVHTPPSEEYEDITEWWNARVSERVLNGIVNSCPFCGGHARIESDDEVPADGVERFRIVCPDCGAATNYCLSVKKVVKAWNKTA